MAQLVAVLPYITTAITAYSAISQGESANAAAQGRAAQMRAQANIEQASGQRAFIDEKRQTNYVASRAQAVAAASGAGVSDPTVANLIAGIQGEGEYRALTAMYQGDVTARGLEYGANVSEREGRAARTAGYMKGAATVLSSDLPTSMYQKYGDGGPQGRRMAWAGSAGRALPGRRGYTAATIPSPTFQDFQVDPSLVPG